MMRTASIVLAATVILATSSNASGPIVGQATVIDGDTIEVRGERIRLFGIDAPEAAQLCRDSGGKPYRCGARAANALADMIGRRPVSCIEVDRDRYRRAVAVCTVQADRKAAGDAESRRPIDIADWLVRRGLAVDFKRYSDGAYADAETEARAARAGMWSGPTVAPWDFRRCIRSGGRPATCSE